ncbi:MAG: OmpA family protein [Cyclobacteriaceae bacterium]|nr:OmpA family protein [Cyclobacteriaceae bacterium]
MKGKMASGEWLNVCLRSISFLGLLLFHVVHSVNAQESNPFKLVNSIYDEQSPLISPDGKVLYLTIANHPQNLGGKKDLGDIWVSLNLDGVWQAPIHGGAEINNENYNAPIGFSRDGAILFLIGHYSKNGIVNTQGISYTEKTSSGWSMPKNISIPYFLNKSDLFSAAVDDDQSVLVYSAESFITTGAEDIYICTSQNGRWSEPVNVGKQINTARQEVSPWLSGDKKTLYFASNGWQGLGSFDVFKSERLDDTWKNWSTPFNVGSAINSEARELFYRNINGKILFTTTRDSDGYGDIREQPDANRSSVDTVRKIVEQVYTSTNSKMVLISGVVTNAKGGVGLSAKLIFKSDSAYVVNSSTNGKYQIQIPTTKAYTIEVQKKGFVNVVERLDLNSMKLNSLQMDFRLQPIEVGTVVNLKSVLFNMGTTTLLEESYPELDAVVDFLKENSGVEIQLEGHTDNRGDPKKNMQLSQERVARIKSYLVSKGISGKRVKGKGFGGAKPIATGDSEESRKLNRRVEFLIVKS